MKESNTKKAKLAYGSSLDDTPDVTNEKLHELCESFIEKKM